MTTIKIDLTYSKPKLITLYLVVHNNGKSAKAYLRIGCTYCRSGRWTTPNKSLDVEGQTANEHIQANHTIKHFVEPIPPHFATTYRDSIQPYVVSLFCLFAHPNHFLQVSIQIYLVDQKPKVLEGKNIFKKPHSWSALLFRNSKVHA